MKQMDLLAFIKKERLKLIRYVRSLIRETATMEAEDIVHDVLLKILEKADLLGPTDNIMAYVYRSLKNRVIDLIRTGKPTLSLNSNADSRQNGIDSSLIDLLHDLSPNGLEILLNQQGEKELFSALQQLSEIERTVLIAHELEDISFKELCEKLDIPVNTLLSHKSRAMRKLKQYFSER
jgi:RNA polymerase sigma factor (sigma-70 family)